jgi:hypothetical protein
MNWKTLLRTIAPIILAMHPATNKIAGTIGEAIDAAEALHDAGTGTEKKKYVLQIAKSALVTHNTFNPEHAIDVETALKATGTAVDTIVEVTNLVHEGQKPVPPSTSGV